MNFAAWYEAVALPHWIIAADSGGVGGTDISLQLGKIKAENVRRQCPEGKCPMYTHKIHTYLYAHTHTFGTTESEMKYY